jgi:hypothetical protein
LLPSLISRQQFVDKTTICLTSVTEPLVVSASKSVAVNGERLERLERPIIRHE